MTLETLELKLGASAKNSITWSQDGEIAIATGEDCYLLLPNYGEEKQTKPWEHLYFAANKFTNEEWPEILTPSSTKGLFIGMEQRPPEIAALEWSAPGLARHDRCALAILSTNGHLRIWLPGPDANLALDWKPMLNLNVTVANGRISLLQRNNVRAFAWNPIFEDGSTQQIAMVTEDGLYVLEITRSETSLQAQVLTSQALEGLPNDISFREMIEASHRGVHIAWLLTQHAVGTSMGVAKSCLSVIRQGSLSTFILQNDKSADSKDVWTLSASQPRFPAHGPMYVNESDIFYFVRQSLHSVSIERAVSQSEKEADSGDDVNILASLDGWDSVQHLVAFGSKEMQALVASKPQSSLFMLNLASKPSDEPQRRTKTTLVDSRGSHLAKRFTEARDAWSSNHGVGDKVRARYHGIATCGLNKEYLAMLVSFWPTEQIVYQSKVQDRTNLILTHASLEPNGGSDDELKLPWQDSGDNIKGKLPVDSIFALLETADADSDKGRLLALLTCAQLLLRDEIGSEKAMQALNALIGKGKDTIMTSWNTLENKTDDELTELVASITEQIDRKSATSLSEKCPIPGCSEPLRFSTHELPADAAVCTGIGHTFARCSITRLAILQPYISKQCEACSRTFLDEEKMPNEPALPKSMIQAFKRCPYCQGRFTG